MIIILKKKELLKSKVFGEQIYYIYELKKTKKKRTKYKDTRKQNTKIHAMFFIKEWYPNM